MRAKNIDFVIAVRQVICTKEISTVSILLADGNTIELHNVFFAPWCDSNLISLGQLQEGEITYQNDPSEMVLVQCKEVIARAKRNQNLFTLELAQPERAMVNFTLQPKAKAAARVAGQSWVMAITGRDRPTQLMSRNERIWLWHWQLTHISNVGVVKASKLVDGINLENENKEYDPTEVLIDSDNSDVSDCSDRDQESPPS